MGATPQSVRVFQSRHQELNFRELLGEIAQDLQLQWPNAMDFMIARSGQHGDLQSSPIAPASNKPSIERCLDHRVKKWMPNIGGLDAMRFEPLFFKRQIAQHVVHVAPHLLNAPTTPGPQLRWQVIKHRQPVLLCPLGNVPIEAREVDQDHSVDVAAPEAILGHIGNLKELAQSR